MIYPDNIDFVQQMARLIYCAGQIDGEFTRDEKEASLKIIHQLSQEEFGQYAEGLMIKEISDLLEHQTEPEGLVLEFADYYHSNQQLFSEEAKRSILQTVDRIVYTHSNRNKSELLFLSRLELLFFGKLL